MELVGALRVEGGGLVGVAPLRERCPILPLSNPVEFRQFIPQWAARQISGLQGAWSAIYGGCAGG